ncbi:MAG: sigma-70 family RNA polymerase sigma factor, partial [Anaerolineales bacterium]
RRESQEAIQSSKHSGDMDSPEVEVLRSESLGEVEHAMEFLDVRERDVIALKFGAALTNKEIAAIYGISPANSAVIFHRAIKKLRRLLGAERDENG